MSHVSYVPKLSMHLMSVSQLIDFDCQVVFDRTSCRMQDRSGVVIGVDQRRSGVYTLESLNLSPTAASALHCHVVVLDFHQWHHRLGHLCPSRLSSLISHGCLGIVSPRTDVIYHGCKLGK